METLVGVVSQVRSCSVCPSRAAGSMIVNEDAEAPATTQFNGSIAMPMRDRLLGAVASASPGNKKLPLQLPPPPPGMPARQVEKWRKEVAKIVSKQVCFLYFRFSASVCVLAVASLHPESSKRNAEEKI